MSWLRVDLEEGRSAFRPGEEISGVVAWALDAPAEAVEARLMWYTAGKGDRDVDVIATAQERPARQEGRLDFRFRLPESPYSFSGALISLVWAVEAVALPSGEAARSEIAVAPGGREILLPRDDPDREATR